MNPLKVKLLNKNISDKRKKFFKEKDLRQKQILDLKIKIDQLKLKLERIK